MDDRLLPPNKLRRAQVSAEQALATLHRFLSVEAVSGAVLLIAAAVALIWTNSPFAHSYHTFWHLPLSIGFGEFVFSRSLHFWINDVLMTVFFLVVGMEIRREIHEGALSRLDQALLPVIAAAGGVIVPALIYLSLNADSSRRVGWADRHGYSLCRGRACPARAIDPSQCAGLPAGFGDH
jgi:Na+:H+ antiporter, NhaA family